ncbi:MAG: glycoside hydrolase family 88 protein [Bacteroidaceae bacterium]|nr:glycoside hydrolase family 88 protein [Bacteroidaceae bacterium]
MSLNVISSFKLLKTYSENEQFRGWDPYDGLNSKVFNAIPFLNKSSFIRLAVIQGFKKLPVNLRKVAMVPKKHNAKGLGLLLSGYCNLYETVKAKPELSVEFGRLQDIEIQINELAELLISMQSEGYSGACWGYTFDWQSKAFFLPIHTPTVVATSFVVEALLSTYEVTQNKQYLNTALSSADFVLKDLNRIDKPNGFMFSYSPLDNRAVYNATLLGTKTLALIYKYTGNEDYKNAARASAQAVCDEQNSDGSFPHSDQVRNQWRDSFHTGFKLESLAIYQQCCNDNSFSENIERGYKYWIEHYFVPETGLAKYYDNSTEKDTVDLHCVAQAIPTICKLSKIDNSTKDLMHKALEWAINNMQSEKGYFYFQKKGNSINKIPYMRWPNAWMFYGMSYFIKNNI